MWGAPTRTTSGTVAHCIILSRWSRKWQSCSGQQDVCSLIGLYRCQELWILVLKEARLGANSIVILSIVQRLEFNQEPHFWKFSQSVNCEGTVCVYSVVITGEGGLWRYRCETYTTRSSARLLVVTVICPFPLYFTLYLFFHFQCCLLSSHFSSC